MKYQWNYCSHSLKLGNLLSEITRYQGDLGTGSSLCHERPADKVQNLVY